MSRLALKCLLYKREFSLLKENELEVIYFLYTEHREGRESAEGGGREREKRQKKNLNLHKKI